MHVYYKTYNKKNRKIYFLTISIIISMNLKKNGKTFSNFNDDINKRYITHQFVFEFFITI